MLPHQNYLDAGVDALGVVRGLSYYEATHGERLPPGYGKLTDQLAAERLPVLKNGYAFQLDGLFRTREIDGELANGRQAFAT